MKYPRNTGGLGFNPKPSTIMHIDLNSCFATIEQQANPFLRGKPIAVAAYTTPSGCILAPSVEAKKLGIKVGMRVKDGKLICPDLIVLEPDPWKYRNVHLSLRKILSDYTLDFNPKSIDEFVLDLERYLHLHDRSTCHPGGNEVTDRISICRDSITTFQNDNSKIEGLAVKNIAKEIKKRIKEEIGEWLTVSIGISTNRFLAKLASNLHKPDGLDEINKNNHLDVYASLKLTDLWGIKMANASRLNSAGIYTVVDFYNASPWKLKIAFQSIASYYWYMRLHGWETCPQSLRSSAGRRVDNVEFGRRSYGNSYAIPNTLISLEELSPILSKLVTKMGARLRRAGFKACGVHVSAHYKDSSFWHKGVSFSKSLFDSRDIYKKAFKILSLSPYKKPVRELAVSCFNLLKSNSTQLDLFDDVLKRKKLVDSIDQTNERWGDFVITPARMLSAKDNVPDRIAFGGVKELEEFTLNDANRY